MLVGEAHILVKAITTGIAGDIKRGFDGLSGGASSKAASSAGARLGQDFSRGMRKFAPTNIFGDFANKIEELVPGAEAARDAMHDLVRTSYLTGTALAGLIGTISAVGGGLVALGGAALGAVPSVAALAGAFVGLKIGMLGAKMSFSGIGAAVSAATKQNTGLTNATKQAKKAYKDLLFQLEESALGEKRAGLNLQKAREALLRTQDLPGNSTARKEALLAYEEAELAYRKAKSNTKDLQDQQKKGAALGGMLPTNDPFASLTKSQKEFAQFLVKLQPKLKELREAVASGFLPLLQTQIKSLVDNYFPMLKDDLHLIGISLGKATGHIADMLNAPANKSNVDSIFKNSTNTIDKFGTVISNVLESFMKLIVAADPITQRFMDFLVKKTGDFSKNLDKMDLDKFFKTAGDLAADFGKIFGNIFGGFGAIIKANVGPGSGGQIMLDWLKQATDGFGKLGSTVDGEKSLRKYFQDVANNSTHVFSAIGALLKQISGIGTMPEIGQAFDILKAGAPFVGDILKQSVKAMPSLAKLVVVILKIIDQMMDTGAVQIFFDTLTSMAEGVSKVLENKTVQDILRITGRIAALFLAVGKAYEVAAFLGKYVAGVVKFGASIGDAYVKVRSFFVNMTLAPGGFMKVLGRLGEFLTRLPVIGWIITIIALFVELYQRSDEFRTIVSNTMAGIGDSFAGLWDSLKGLFDQLFGNDGIGGILVAIQPVTDFLLKAIFPVLGAVISNIVGALTVAIDFVTSLIKTIMNGVKPMIEGIMDLFQGKFGPGMKKIFGGMAIIFIGIFEGIVNAVISMVNLFITVLNNMIKAIGDGPVGQFLKTISGGSIDLGKVKLSKVQLVDWTSVAKKNLEQSSGTKMAEGGTVFPRSGGTMVTVAEAGRPERIEPLHSNGLSDRDIAIINKLSGGSGVNITVNPAPGMDERALAEMVSRRIAFEIRKGTI